MSFCKKCGSELEAGNKFCQQCGEPVEEHVSYTQQNDKTESESSGNKILALFKNDEGNISINKILLIFVGFIILLWGYGFIKGVSDVSNEVPLLFTAQTMNRLNPISAHGYKSYLLNFTNYKEIQQDLKDSMEEFNDFNDSMNSWNFQN